MQSIALVPDDLALNLRSLNDRYRRILLVPVRPSERPFSEPTPAVRRWQRDRRHDWCFF